MPPVVRLGDICTGHGCWPPRANSSASTDVFVNSRGVHRLGDSWSTHCCPAIPECHGGSASSSSQTVFVNSKGVCRIGDSVSCGSTMATGSPNVIAGD